MQLLPTRIEPYSPTEMLLEWSSGEKFAVPYTEIRFECPCAVCIDEHTGKRVITRESVAPDVRATGVELVGRYAVHIRWSDGHATGMYHYDRLYELSRARGKKA